ncbi:ABC transporter substrate-binding protein [Breznakiella homolactica]|uniref:Extracellular solute-binding protein n=1 Tax=Breznakiella homolactica TaxID=2798577 RepID=A0A7T7XKF0_9SPIR|nr:extracellular solute-binding protein [Breznakiella homolactica]QQO07930.1 extracellular solute-binding protein [Breznakiella homolactica]
MKKGLLVVMVLILTAGLLFAGGSGDSGNKVQLTFSSWRTEDVAVYEELIGMFQKQNPDISVTYRSYKTEEYQTVLATNFKGGSAADVIHLRAYGNFEQFAQPGYLMPLTEEIIPELKVFSKQSLGGSTSIHDNKVYGVPYASMSIVIYYNKAIYDKLGLKVPETWNEFIANLEKCKSAGITGLANGTYAGWASEVAWGSVAPNVYGGNDFYDALIAGRTNFLDPRFIASLDTFAGLSKYMPSGFTGLDYVEQQMLFINDMAAHFLGGTFEASYFQAQNPDLNFDLFVCPPAKKGDTQYISSYMDGSYGINNASPNKEAAIKFVRFLASKEAQQFLCDKLGVIMEHPDTVPSSPFLRKVANNPALTPTPYVFLVGFRYEQPSGSALMQSGLQALLGGQANSRKVAEDIQTGIAIYYKPFQK